MTDRDIWWFCIEIFYYILHLRVFYLFY
jgi:hypothetical protein